MMSKLVKIISRIQCILIVLLFINLGVNYYEISIAIPVAVFSLALFMAVCMNRNASFRDKIAYRGESVGSSIGFILIGLAGITAVVYDGEFGLFRIWFCFFAFTEIVVRLSIIKQRRRTKTENCRADERV